MSLHRKQLLLAACTLVVLAIAPAFGQEGLRDMQLFDMADMTTYGGGAPAHQGFFFSFDGLTWWISAPDIALIGDDTTRRVVITPQNPSMVDPTTGDTVVDPAFEPNKVIEFSSLDTESLYSEETAGRRYNFGFVEEHHGWLCSIMNFSQQSQWIYGSDVHMTFDDAAFGDPPMFHLQGPIWAQDDILDVPGGQPTVVVDDLSVRFEDLTAHYTLKTWGAELSYLYRTHPFHCGGILEWYFGVRYLEFNDRFVVQGSTPPEDQTDPLLAVPYGLGDSWWENRVQNHIVGPQIGFHWFRKNGRWTWSTEGRAFAGFNEQNVRLTGLLGEGLDPAIVYQEALAGTVESELKMTNFSATRFSHSRRFHEFSPAAELRLNLTYELTRCVSLGFGWTVLWMDKIARSPGLIDYTLGQDSVMGIGTDNTEWVLAHGVNATVSVNRY